MSAVTALARLQEIQREQEGTIKARLDIDPDEVRALADELDRGDLVAGKATLDIEDVDALIASAMSPHLLPTP